MGMMVVQLNGVDWSVMVKEDWMSSNIYYSLLVRCDENEYLTFYLSSSFRSSPLSNLAICYVQGEEGGESEEKRRNFKQSLTG